MRLVLKWKQVDVEWNYLEEKYITSKLDTEKIVLHVVIKGLSEEKTEKFLDELEEQINKELGEIYGYAYFGLAGIYGGIEENALYESIEWERDFGNVAEQKKEIVQTIRKIYKSLKKKYV